MFSKSAIYEVPKIVTSVTNTTAAPAIPIFFESTIILGKKIKIRGALIQVGEKKINFSNWNWKEIEKNSFFSPDKNILKTWEDYVLKIRKEGSSIGAVIQITASGVPPGLGEPVFSKIDALLAQGIMSIPAVKGVEIGNGFKSAALRGEQNADEMRYQNNKIMFESNNSGGTLGGISSGQDIVVKFAVKPTSSILTERKTVNLANKNKKPRASFIDGEKALLLANAAYKSLSSKKVIKIR